MNNIKEILIHLIGEYVPRTPIIDSLGNVHYTGLISIDYPWVFSAILLIVTFISIVSIVKSVLTAIVR